METNYRSRTFPYARCVEQSQPATTRPVVVIGAGPVGLATAIDLAQQGVPVVLLDDDCRLSTGSRAICFAKRTLDVLDRLGCGDRLVDKGVSWNVGKVFFDEELVYTFDLLPETGHHRPAFINLQQYYLEGFLVDRAGELARLDLRWQHRVTALSQHADHVELAIDTPDGPYTLNANYVVAADGARSPVRQLMGLDSKGRTFRDRFLIADVRMDADFPSERWFWFDPPFNRNQSALLHRQPDNVWRIDFQLGWDADPEVEKQPERVIPRIQALLGEQARFELEWVSVYTFSCERMDSFRHGRVLFAGDAAHRVSPFGARGANSGIQDAENLAWKLKLVLDGIAPPALLDTYASEREHAADENLLNSSRTADFITPKSPVSRLFRDGVLRLSRRHAFARRLVNSGRLSVPAVLAGSPLNTRDTVEFAGTMTPGAACADAPVAQASSSASALSPALSPALSSTSPWLLAHLGNRFTAMVFAGPAGLPSAAIAALEKLAEGAVPVAVLCVLAAGHGNVLPSALPRHARIVEDSEGLVARRYDGRPGTCYLVRPDQHVCARWRDVDADGLQAALRRALGMHDLAWQPAQQNGAEKGSTATLLTEPNLARPDDVYEALIDMHAGLSDAQSQSANAQLLLLLANHIGDPAVLGHAMALARASVLERGSSEPPATAPNDDTAAPSTPSAAAHAPA